MIAVEYSGIFFKGVGEKILYCNMKEYLAYKIYVEAKEILLYMKPVQ